MSLQDITTRIQSKSANAASLGATVKFACGDDGVIFIDGKATPPTVSNENVDADCTISLKLADLDALTKGELDPTTAFMMGKLKVQGNMGIAMKLQSLFG
jgi:putative sterol carrier protein